MYSSDRRAIMRSGCETCWSKSRGNGRFKEDVKTGKTDVLGYEGVLK
jgi:hypothetical protein